jgi:hypothetical protein
MKYRYAPLPVVALLALCLTAPSGYAALLGTVDTPPGSTVFPGLVPSGTDPGTLLASLIEPFTSSLGFNSGTIVSAVYREAGGTLDFYYQVTNNLTAPNCGTMGKPSCDPLSRETDTNFTGFTTATGFRTDGGSLGGPFVDGTVAPVTADRNSTADVVGFSFNLTDATKIQPGEISNVLVISTNATSFKAGNASVIDGGVTTVAAFEPAVSTTVPEPASFLMLGGGLLAMMGVRRVLFH